MFLVDKKQNYGEIIRKCYLEILEREADNEGLNYFLDLMKMGEINEEKLRDHMKNSEEYKILSSRKHNTTKHHPAGNFFIKENYLHRLQPEYFHDVFNKNEPITWQPYVYTLATSLDFSKSDSIHVPNS